MLLFGLGLGASGVAAAIVAVGSVSERDSGLASGINNAAFQVGGALGVAVLSTTAISRTEQLLVTGHQVQSLFALTEGYRLAFLVAVGFALVGLLAPLVLLARSGSLADRG